MRECQQCGKQYEGNFCPYCGAKWIEEQATERVCPDCGENVAPSMRFCANCGYDFSKKQSSEEIKAEKKMQAALLRTANFMEAIPTMLRVGNAVLSAIFAVLLWILFALPVTEILGESIGNLYQFMNGTTVLGELLEPMSVIGWVIFLAVLATGYSLYVLYATISERKNCEAHMKHTVFNLCFALFHVVFFIVGCVVRSTVSDYGLPVGACANALMICSAVFFVVSLTISIASYTLTAKAKAPLTPEEIAAKEAKKAVLMARAKKIVKPACALGAVALTVVIVIGISTNIFRAGKVDNIAMGADEEAVLDILGEPYEKDSRAEYAQASHDTVWKYYSKSYTKIYDKIAELEEKAENMTSLGDLGNILEEGLNLEEEALKVRYKYIEVAFKDGTVVAIYLDKDKCDSDMEQKQIGVSSCGLTSMEYSEFSSTNIFTEDKQMRVEYSNGNYANDTFSVCAEKSSSYYDSDGNITWQDAFGEHTQHFENFVSRPANIGDVKIIEGENATYKYTLLSFSVNANNNKYDDNEIGDVLLEVTIHGTTMPKYATHLSSSYRISETHMTITGDITDWGERRSGTAGTLHGYLKNSSLFPNLTSVCLSDALTSIGDEAFAGCVYLKSIVIPSGVVKIDDEAFLGCESLTSVIIPDSVIDIGDYAFNSTNIESVVFGKNSLLESIGDDAFSHCENLKSVTIPSKVTQISFSSFSQCGNLESIIVEAGNTTYHSTDNCLVETSTKTLIRANNTGIIPESVDVDSIGEEALSGLPYIVFSSNIKTIDEDSFGWSSFSNNKILYYKGSPSDLASVGIKRTFSETDFWPTCYFYTDNEPTLPANFWHYDETGSIIHWPTVTTENENYSKDLRFKTNGLCYTLAGIGKCTDTDIVVPGFYNGLLVLSISEEAFYDCDSLTSITISDGVTNISDHAFAHCSGLTSITIPSSVTSIGEYAFYDCDSLTSITISDGVTNISDHAFASCDSLTSITIPSSVTSIGSRAFYDCDSLTSITIPSSVTSIGGYAFESCDSLTSITISDGVTNISDHAFAHCSDLTSITIPSSVTSIGAYAFEDCDSLASITIPSSVTSIGEFAFAICDSLTSITFVGTKAQWGNISKGFRWNDFYPYKTITVRCTNGTVTERG